MGPHSKAPHSRNRLEALYCDVVQQLEQLQFQNLRKTAKQYFQTVFSAPHKHVPRAEDDGKVQDRLNQRHILPQSNLPKHSHRHDVPVNSECEAFPKYWNQTMGTRNDRSRQKSEVTVKLSRSISSKSATSSNRKVERLENEPGNLRPSKSPPRTSQSSNEIGDRQPEQFRYEYRRFRKSIETTGTTTSSSTARTAVGCDTLRRSSKGNPKSQPLTPVETECSSTFFHIRNQQYTYEGTSPPINNKLETRPVSMTLRRRFNCNSLMEGVKSQRALDAKLGSRKREGLNAQDVNAPVTIVILTKTDQPSIRNEDGIQKSRNRCSEAPTGHYLSGNKVELQKGVNFNGATRASDQIGSQRPNSNRATLDSPLAQKCRPLATASRTTAILQDALEALECAHRWNEWGARTLHELTRASKAAAERNNLLLGWACKDRNQLREKKPEILLPHDNDVVMSTRRGRVLESREEEREFIRDLLVASGITNGGWVDKDLLQHVVSGTQLTTPYRLAANAGSMSFKRTSTKAEGKNIKVVEKRILRDFVEELLRHEHELREYAQIGRNLMHEHERQGQALVQRVWNHLQICPSPASEDICTTVQNILHRDLKSQGSTWAEMAEVVEELDKMIYEHLMQELLEDLTALKSK